MEVRGSWPSWSAKRNQKVTLKKLKPKHTQKTQKGTKPWRETTTSVQQKDYSYSQQLIIDTMINLFIN